MSIRSLVSHNSYTQVGAEVGMLALLFYAMFMVAPLRGLRQIERETVHVRSKRRFYFLAVGLQASLVGYMASSFFASVAYYWFLYYLVGYAVCLRQIYADSTDPIKTERNDDAGAAAAD
jgi:O-antigen ligase